MPSREIRSLDQLMDGAIVERFNNELRKVWENIFDMRTDPNKVRSISLVFRFVPNESRDAAIMGADVTLKLVPPKALYQTVLMYQQDDGTVRVSEHTSQLPGQLNIDGEVQQIPNVVEFPVRKQTE